MKYLILFELGKKRFVQAFSSKNAAIKAINSYTELADDVISSINDLDDDKYSVIFSDDSRATFKIQPSKDEAILGYYPADLARIFEKIRAILLKRKEAEEKVALAVEVKEKRRKAVRLTMLGIAIMLAGFAMATLAFSPDGAAWQFAAMGSLILLGLTSTVRGGYKIARPLPKATMRRLARV